MKLRKILAVCISIILVCVVLPLGAVTASAATSGYTGDCTWSLDGTVLTISGYGIMSNHYSKPLPWGTDITEVIIKDGVESIGDRAFEGCNLITSITIPDSVTRIGAGAFLYCDSLKTITIGSGTSSIGWDTFWYCSSLESINVSENNKTYSSVDGVLFDKYVTNLIRYPCAKPDNTYTVPDSVINIEDYSFMDSSTLTSVIITDGVTSIDNYAFYNCSKLTSVTIPSSVETIYDLAFYNCSLLDTVNYAGTEERWKNIIIYSGNTDLTNATIKFAFKLGDADGNGVVNGTDLTYMAKELFKLEAFEAEADNALDVTEDGVFNIVDIVKLKKILLRLE